MTFASPLLAFQPGLLAFNTGLLFMEVLLFLSSLFLMLLILVQRGKGGGLTGALGGMGGQSAFGSKAGDTFTKITIITAVVWITLCMLTIAAFNPPPPPKTVNEQLDTQSGAVINPTDEDGGGAAGMGNADTQSDATDAKTDSEADGQSGGDFKIELDGPAQAAPKSDAENNDAAGKTNPTGESVDSAADSSKTESPAPETTTDEPTQPEEK